jgi:hypothetical protein
MSGIELLRDVYEWLPVFFALDLLLFQLVADDPLAVRWWWGRRKHPKTGVGLA